MAETKEERWAVWDCNDGEWQWIVLHRGMGPIEGRKCRKVQVEVLPPAPPPVSEPVVDEERWAFVSSPTDGIRLRYRGFRPPNKDSRWKLLHVRSAAADEALREKAAKLDRAMGLLQANNVELVKLSQENREALDRAQYHKSQRHGAQEALDGCADKVNDLEATISTLTRERDEARAELETTKTKAGNQISVEKIHAETNRAAVREMCAGITEALGSPMPLTVSGSLKAVREAAARIADLERQVGEERIGRVRFREAIHEALKACDESSFASIEDTLKAAISCDGEIPALYPDIETEVLTLRERTHSLERQLAEATTTSPLTAATGNYTPSSPPSADEAWMERAADDYVQNRSGLPWRDAFLAALRTHAPTPKYPEVVEFLDEFGKCGWSLSYNPNGDPSRLASAWTSGTRRDVHFDRSNIDAACRAALDSVKERAFPPYGIS